MWITTNGLVPLHKAVPIDSADIAMVLFKGSFLENGRLLFGLQKWQIDGPTRRPNWKDGQTKIRCDRQETGHRAVYRFQQQEIRKS